MWPLPRINDELVAIVMSPSHLSLGVIKKTMSPIAPFELHAYRSIPIKDSMHKTMIYNTTFLEQQIGSFVATYKLEDAFFALCISGERVEERLVKLKNSSPTTADFSHLALHKLVWDYTYLYAHEQGEFVFAVSGVQRELLFQYQLLALSLGINLVTLTTPFNPLISLYRYVQGAAFRQAKLASDMQAHQHRLENYFTPTMYNRIVHAGQQVESGTLLSMIGLYCMERGNNEKN